MQSDACFGCNWTLDSTPNHTEALAMARCIDRHITHSLLQALSDMPVVCLLGPKQSGQSTLAKACLAHRHYLTLDDPNQLQWAKTAEPKDALGLRRLAHRTGDQFKGGLLFYDGTLTIPLDPALGIYAVPISKLWQSPVTQTRTTSDPSPTYGRA